jgi:hypothetical protein
MHAMVFRVAIHDHDEASGSCTRRWWRRRFSGGPMFPECPLAAVARQFASWNMGM